MKFVQVRLRDDITGEYSEKKYTFKTHMDDLQPNDIVVVDTNTKKVLHFGKVVGYIDSPGLPYYKHVLAKIDRDAIVNFLKRLEDS